MKYDDCTAGLKVIWRRANQGRVGRDQEYPAIVLGAAGMRVRIMVRMGCMQRIRTVPAERLSIMPEPEGNVIL